MINLLLVAQWLNDLQTLLSEKWLEVLAILSTPIVGGLTIWKLGSIIVNLIRRKTFKKYLDPLKAQVDTLKNALDDTKQQLKDVLTSTKEEIVVEVCKNLKEMLQSTFNEYEKTKTKIYNDIINENGENLEDLIKEFEPNVVKVEEQINTVEEQINEVSNIIQENEENGSNVAKNEPNDTVGDILL